MALSVTTFSLLHSQTQTPIFNFSKHKLPVTIKPHSTFFSLKQPRPPIQSTSVCSSTKSTQSSYLSSLATHFLSTHKEIPKLLAENGVKLLLGSLILVGSISPKPVFASPVQKGEILEEERETQNGKFEDEEMCVKILENEPRNVEALKVVVSGKMRRRKTKEAVKYVETLIDIEPDKVEWRLLQALCYEMMGQLTTAKRLFTEILKEQPLLLRALHGLAMVLHKNHEDATAFDMLNKALELACRNKRVTEERNIKILIAQMHMVKGDLDGALKKYQELIDENPRDFRPYLCQGIIYSLQDKKKEADEQFEIYRGLVPEEFPQRSFLDDVVLAAKTESREQLEKDFKGEYSYNKR